MHENSQPASPPSRGARTSARPALLLAAAIAVAVVAVGCGSDTATPGTAENGVAVSATGIRALARTLHQPIYWVGTAANVTYERTLPGDGRVVLRYLPTGAAVGSTTPYLTVGTYIVPDAYAATQRAAGKTGAVRIQVASSASAIAFSTSARPLNAWITYPGSRYQIEVFDPKPGRARHFVASGSVARVPGSPREVRPAEISATSLAKIATADRRPIYWAGELPNRTYELTKTGQGGYLVRYLPPGSALGVATPSLTVGTYPVPDALAAVKRLSVAKGALSIKLAHGGLAAINPHFPKSVYLAYPGSPYEIEVFAPSLARARQLVTSGQIVAVT